MLIRRKEIYDGAIPSGNSVALMNLIRLSRITGNSRLAEMADTLVKAFSGEVSPSPIAYTYFMAALDFAVGPSYEVVIAGDLQSDDTKALLTALRTHFVPRMVVLHRPEGESPEIGEIATFVVQQKSLDGKATAYVCEDFACNVPVSDAADMLRQLGVKPEAAETKKSQ